MSMIPIVRSALFERFSGLRFGMSTRRGGVSPSPLDLNLSFNVGDDPENVRKNRELYFAALGVDSSRVAFAGQIHGDVVRQVKDPGKHDACDALETVAPGIFLAVSVADCIPVFLYDPFARCVAAVHSGWRGSEAKIVVRALERLSAAYASRPENIVAFIGPGAGACCYEVGTEVAVKFPEEYRMKGRGANPHLDLKKWNKDLLEDAGVEPSHIELSPSCTICDVRFHSYRRDGSGSGRMLGVIGMTSPH